MSWVANARQAVVTMRWKTPAGKAVAAIVVAAFGVVGWNARCMMCAPSASARANATIHTTSLTTVADRTINPQVADDILATTRPWQRGEIELCQGVGPPPPVTPAGAEPISARPAGPIYGSSGPGFGPCDG